MAVVTSGLPEISRAFSVFSVQFPKNLRKSLKWAAEPVRARAETRAGQQVRNLGIGDPWTGMRTGGGTKIVYIAPKQRGLASKKNKRLRRPNIKPHILRGMETALFEEQHAVTARLNTVLAQDVKRWGANG